MGEAKRKRALATLDDSTAGKTKRLSMESSHIHNDDVPKLIYYSMKELVQVLHSLENHVDETNQTKFDIFKTFYKQYSTILNISKGGSHAYDPQFKYLDIKSTYVLIRSMHEAFLVFNYLTSSGWFDGFSPTEENSFKYMCYDHGGCIDGERMILLSKNSLAEDFFEKQLSFHQKRRAELHSKIEAHKIYPTLSNEVRKSIRQFGAWRIGKNKVLSWNELSDSTPMMGGWAKREYYVLSTYAHSSKFSINLERQHDGERHGLLMHLYVVASMMIVGFCDYIKWDRNRFTADANSIIEEFLAFGRGDTPIKLSRKQ